MATARSDAVEDRGRLQRLIRAHGRVVEAYVASIERDEMARDELWSDVFRTALAHLDELEGFDPSRARSWLLSTAHHLTANAARATSARRRLIERLSRERSWPAAAAEDAFFEAAPSPEQEGQRPLVKAAWDRLSGDQRELLALAALGHGSPAIAELLGITPGAVRVRISRARKAFRSGDEQERDGDGDDAEEGRP